MPRKQSKQNLAGQMEKDLAFWRSRAGSFLVLAVFAVHPLILNEYASITGTKTASFLAITGISLLLLAMLSLLAASTIPGCLSRARLRELPRKVRPYEYALLAYWLVLLASALGAGSLREAFLGSTDRNEGFLMMSVYILAAAIVGRCYRPRRRDLLVLAAVAGLIAAYGICQYYGFDFLGISPDDPDQGIGPALIFVATMSNRNVISSYLCLAFCVSAVLFARKGGDGRKERLLRLSCLFMALVQFYMLILGQTESGYAGLGLAFPLLFPLLARCRKDAARLLFLLSGCLCLIRLSVRLYAESWGVPYWEPFSPYLLPAAAVLAGIAALLYFLPFLPEELPAKPFRIAWYCLLLALLAAVVVAIPRLAASTGNATLAAANEILKGNFDDSYGSNRLYIWKRALSMIPERPLLGHGPDNFFSAFAARFGVEGKALGLPSFDKAHNEYLQVLFDAGALGLLAQLSFFGLTIASARNRLKEPMILAVLLALVCFLIQSFFNIFSPFAHPVAWVLWGFLAALAYSAPPQSPGSARP